MREGGAGDTATGVTATPELEVRVRRAEVSLAYAQARAGFVISLVNGVIVALLLARVVATSALVAWLVVLVGVSAVRAVLVRARVRAEAVGADDDQPWRARFVASALVGGLVWGVLATLLFPDSIVHQLAVAIVLAGLGGGSVSYFSSIPAAYYAFAASALAPYAVRLLVAGGEIRMTIGGLTVLYAVALAANVRRVHAAIRGSFVARFANEELVLRLRAEVDERTKAEERRAASEQLFRGAFESVAAGMCLLDAEGRHVLVNQAMCAMLGYTEDELLARGVFDITPADDVERLRARFAALTSEEAHDELFEERLLTKDGRELWVQGSVRVPGSAGARRYVVQFVDVTERRALDTMKAEFIATVSHELRTPLTAIHGALGLLGGGVAGDLPPIAHDLVDTARSNSVRLRKLVDDLLDFEKLTTETLALSKRRVHVAKLLDEVVACAEPYAQTFGVRIERATAPGDPVVETDPDRLGQVLTNLLSNAAKFSRPGGVVEASLRCEAGRVVLSVRDHGVGIPPAFHDQMFKKFSQVDSSDSRAKGGTGLGLSISKAIVDRLGGEISFESTLGVGTTFHVALPAARSEPPAAPV